MLRGASTSKKTIILIITVIFIAIILISEYARQSTPRVRLGDKGNLGAYYFETDKLDILNFDVAYVRTAIPWGPVEPTDGNFSWDSSPIKKIDRALEHGVSVVPVIRAVGADWALREPSIPGSSSPPIDLENTFDKEYGYSKSYYNFVVEIAKHYRGKFKIVVIGNEATGKTFWSGSMEEYLRLLATARKAFKDIDPEVKVADSGMTSPIWGLLITQELLEENKEEEALGFFNAYFSQHYVISKVASVAELRAYLADDEVKNHVTNAEYMLQRLSDYVDVVNFHYYEDPEFFPTVISFIKKKVGDVPVMCNELGARYKSEVENREERAGEDLVKKLAISRALNLEVALWFPFTNENHNIIGLISENKENVEMLIKVFNATLDFLNQPLLGCENLSSNKIQRYSFSFDSERVEVLWSQGESEVDVPTDWNVYDFQGDEIKNDGTLEITFSPIFLVQSD